MTEPHPFRPSVLPADAVIALTPESAHPSHPLAEGWQLSQGFTQTQTIAQMETDTDTAAADAAARVELHTHGNAAEAAASAMPNRSSTHPPLAAVGRTLSLSSIHTDAFQSISPYRLSQGEEGAPSTTGHSSNGTPRARVIPVPLPLRAHHNESEESDSKRGGNEMTDADVPRAATPVAASPSPLPLPLPRIALHVPSPSLRLPPSMPWTADANRSETMLRGRTRAGHLTTAQMTPQVQRQTQPAATCSLALESPVPHAGGIPRGQVSYTPLPVAGSLRHAHLCESDVVKATELWRDYLAQTDPLADSPINSILKQVAEQIDWILDCLQSGLERKQQNERVPGAQQEAGGLESITDEQIQELLAECGPKQIHVVLKHNLERVMVRRGHCCSGAEQESEHSNLFLTKNRPLLVGFDSGVGIQRSICTISGQHLRC